MLAHVMATRYVSPLREGGSLPGLVEADDLGTYVMKFRGAGQGVKALVAEVVVGELARRLGMRVPELRVIELDPAIGRYEPDEEVQDLLTASVGANLGIDFLPGSLGYDGVSHPVDADEAATTLWLDGFVANVDRTWKNPNLLVWHGQLWCIDHGAALYFHHSWPRDVDPARFAVQPYAFDDHVLSEHRQSLPAADEKLTSLLSEAVLRDVLDDVPDSWLVADGDAHPGGDAQPDARPDNGAVTMRRRYLDYLLARLQAPRLWLPEATS